MAMLDSSPEDIMSISSFVNLSGSNQSVPRSSSVVGLQPLVLSSVRQTVLQLYIYIMYTNIYIYIYTMYTNIDYIYYVYIYIHIHIFHECE